MSAPTWVIFFVIYVYWVVYALLDGLVPLLASATLSLVAILAVLVQLRHQWDRAATLAAVGSTVVVAAALAVSPETAVWLSGALAVGLRVPQIRELMVARSTVGVSIATWALSVTMNVLWVAYGLSEQRLAFAVSNAAIGITSLIVLLLGVWRHQTATPNTRPIG